VANRPGLKFSESETRNVHEEGVQALSEARGRCDALALHTLVRLAGREVFVFLSSSARPLNHGAFDLVTFSQAKRYREF
jgi:hypothetical protein